jgi:hypothetical protein
MADAKLMWTTKDVVKTLLDIPLLDTDVDGVLDQVILGTSERVQRDLGRWQLAESRTELCPIRHADKVVWLRGFPVTAVVGVKLLSHPSEVSDADVLGVRDYWIDQERGVLELANTSWSPNPGYVSIEYTGGMVTPQVPSNPAADTATLHAEFPDLAYASALNVVNEYYRRTQPGGDIRVGDAVTIYQGEVVLLNRLRDEIAANSRIVNTNV